MVEEPATDGDSDHTDSEATVNSKNTCELLTFLVHVVLKMVLGMRPTYLHSDIIFTMSCVHGMLCNIV